MYKNMNSKEIKSLITKVITDEAKKDNVDVDLHVYSIIGYRKSPLYKEKLKLDKSYFWKSFVVSNFYDIESNEIYLFTDYFSNITNYIVLPQFKNKNQLYNILRNSYHEYRHRLQNLQNKNIIDLNEFLIKMGTEFDYNSFVSFLDKTSMTLLYKNQPDYSIFHDFYNFEIDAETYSLNKTEEWLKNNSLYLDYKDSVNIDFLYNEVCRYVYDIQVSFYKFMVILNKKNIDEVPYKDTFLEILFIKDKNKKEFVFKNPHDILSNPKFKQLDFKIQYTILSSYHFISQVDKSTLNNVEGKIINNALLYTYAVEQRRENKISEFNNDIMKLRYIPNFDLILLDLEADSWIPKIKRYQKHKKELLGNYYETLNNVFKSKSMEEYNTLK